MTRTVLAGYPRAANYIEGSYLSRGWQTLEDRKTRQTAKDGYSRHAVNRLGEKTNKMYKEQTMKQKLLTIP